MKKLLSLLSNDQSKAKGGYLEISNRDCGKIKFHASVNTISSDSFKAIGLKFGVETGRSNF